MPTDARSALPSRAHVVLPGGLWLGSADAAPVREVALRPVGGEDETFLLDSAEKAVPSERATALLARCLDDADAIRFARALTVGDREALLLHLRRITLGDKIDCVLRCPAVRCNERMEFQLRVGDLLVTQYADVHREYEVAVDTGGAHYEVSFHLPIAADLDHAAMLAHRDLERAAGWLFERSVVRALCDGAPVAVDALIPAVREAVSAGMAERDPQAEIDLDLACPHCGNAFSIMFDIATFFLQELEERAARLTQEVHTLARHYHWSEREILGMPPGRRARYLGLIADAVPQTRPR